jgi:hypothetical protein
MRRIRSEGVDPLISASFVTGDGEREFIFGPDSFFTQRAEVANETNASGDELSISMIHQ